MAQDNSNRTEQSLEQEIRNKALSQTPWAEIVLPNLLKLHRFLKSEEWALIMQLGARWREEVIWDLIYKKENVNRDELRGEVVGLDLMLMLKDQVGRTILKEEEEQRNG